MFKNIGEFQWNFITKLGHFFVNIGFLGVVIDQVLYWFPAAWNFEAIQNVNFGGNAKIFTRNFEKYILNRIWYFFKYWFT